MLRRFEYALINYSQNPLQWLQTNIIASLQLINWLKLFSVYYKSLRKQLIKNFKSHYLIFSTVLKNVPRPWRLYFVKW